MSEKKKIEIMDSEGLYISIPRTLKHIRYTLKVIELIK